MRTFTEFLSSQSQNINELWGWGGSKQKRESPYDKALNLVKQLGQALQQLPQGAQSPLSPEDIRTITTSIENSQTQYNQNPWNGGQAGDAGRQDSDGANTFEKGYLGKSWNADKYLQQNPNSRPQAKPQPEFPGFDTDPQNQNRATTPLPDFNYQKKRQPNQSYPYGKDPGRWAT